jgi:serine phosphatase RsbU (regulator of sigma subunit)
MARTISIRWSLLGSMLALLVLLSSAITVTTVIGEGRIVRTLSSSLTARAIEQTSDRLERFFDPVSSSLDLLRSWVESGQVDPDETDAVNRLLVPVMRPHPQISALLLADERGHHHMLMRTGGRWHARLTRRDVWGIRQRRLEWADGDQTPTLSWHEVDYDPRTRPWYRSAADGSPAPGFVHWTEPYTFFTLKEPGITASVAVRKPDGRDGVVAVDVLLSDISAYTTTLRPTTQGAVVVLTDGGRVIGLPQGPRFADPAAQTSAMLQKPDALGLGVVVAAMRATDTRPGDDPGPIRFTHDGQPWWGEVRSFPLSTGRALSMAVVVPESDLVGVLGTVRRWILLITAAALTLAIVWAIVLARRVCRPIEVLAHENERIGTGDLEPGPAIRSRLTEVLRLTRAHERMRVALRTLFKVERDLQLARQIQQSTLPETLPVLAGFDIAAWCEPAEATGGDTYDVIGIDGKGGEVVTAGAAERAVILLADADGHGVSAALCVTLVRAMLRMGVRGGLDLPAIVSRMNAQLAADLRDGHFVTAWFGQLDARAGTLTALSCGQGPILHYEAARGRCRALPTDAVPLGVLPEIELKAPAPLALAAGDLVAVMSDGIFDAENASGESFGPQRVTTLLEERHDASAAEILDAVTRAVGAFTDGATAADDRTVIIVKRSR